MHNGSKVPGRVLGHLAGVTLSLGLIGCAEPAKNFSADAPRRSTPVPACIYRLAPRGERQQAFVRQVDEKQIWKAVFPGFDDRQMSLPENSLACTGVAVFQDAAFKEEHPRGGWPLQVKEGDLRFGSGPSRLKIVWLRTHESDSGAEAGVVALLRGLEDYVEIYSVGTYRGISERTRLGSERIGSNLIVTAVDEGCQGAKPDQDCDSIMHIYLPTKGALLEQPSIGLERIRYVDKGETGATGRVQYRMVTSPRFAEDGIHLIEQVTAVDESGRRLRQVELERVVRAQGDALTPNSPSLWEKVVQGGPSTSESAGSESAGDKGETGITPSELKNPTTAGNSVTHKTKASGRAAKAPPKKKDVPAGAPGQ